jgi:hypothetical protein
VGDPNQRRGPDGRWISGGGKRVAAAALAIALSASASASAPGLVRQGGLEQPVVAAAVGSGARVHGGNNTTARGKARDRSTARTTARLAREGHSSPRPWRRRRNRMCGALLRAGAGLLPRPSLHGAVPDFAGSPRQPQQRRPRRGGVGRHAQPEPGPPNFSSSWTATVPGTSPSCPARTAGSVSAATSTAPLGRTSPSSTSRPNPSAAHAPRSRWPDSPPTAPCDPQPTRSRMAAPGQEPQRREVPPGVARP